MDKFIKENFEFHGGYLSYNNKFVARFKRNRADVGTFKTFLRKNFTVSEYFDKLKDIAPLLILREKGYMTKMMKNLCREFNLVPNIPNYKVALANKIKN